MRTLTINQLRIVSGGCGARVQAAGGIGGHIEATAGGAVGAGWAVGSAVQ